MLYLIGGVGRSGKSLLTRKLSLRLQISYFGLDTLMMGIHHGHPDWGIGPDIADEIVADWMWLIVKGMAINLMEVEAGYILESAYLLPKHLSQMSTEFGKSVRGLFVGYAATTIRTKQEHIKLGAELPNDWMNGMADEAVQRYADRGIQRSIQAKAQCAEMGVRYLQTARHRAGVIAQFLDGRLDRPTCLRQHRPRAINDMRHRSGAHPCAPGDIQNRDHQLNAYVAYVWSFITG